MITRKQEIVNHGGRRFWIGQRFGNWIIRVLNVYYENPSGDKFDFGKIINVTAIIECEEKGCDVVKEVSYDELKKLKSDSKCICYRTEFIDEIIGSVRVLKWLGINNKNEDRFLVECIYCEYKFEILYSTLINRKDKNCTKCKTNSVDFSIKYRNVRLIEGTARYDKVHHHILVDGICDCGETFSANYNRLVDGTTVNCGGEKHSNTYKQIQLSFSKDGSVNSKTYCPKHVNADKDGFINTGSLNITVQEGRKMEDDDTCHHLSGYRADNRYENIQRRKIRDHPPGQSDSCRTVFSLRTFDEYADSIHISCPQLLPFAEHILTKFYLKHIEGIIPNDRETQNIIQIRKKENCEKIKQCFEKMKKLEEEKRKYEESLNSKDIDFGELDLSEEALAKLTQREKDTINKAIFEREQFIINRIDEGIKGGWREYEKYKVLFESEKDKDFLKNMNDLINRFFSNIQDNIINKKEG